MSARNLVVLRNSFLACVDECLSERESKAFWKGLEGL